MARSFTYDVAEFCELYPDHTNCWLAEKYGVSLPTIVRTARRHQLKKSSSHLKEQFKQRATGRVLSGESKAKIANKAKGRVMSEETKRKMQETKIANGSIPKGENHYKWKGGDSWARFKQPEYIQWRNKVLARDGYTCQDCLRQCKKSESGLAAHHIKPYAKYPEFRLDVDNGLTLCKKCHMARHGRIIPDQKIECACGCGTLIDAFSKYGGRPVRYVNHHGKRGKTKYTQETIFCACGCGQTRNRFDNQGREWRYIQSHGGRVKPRKRKQEWTCQYMSQAEFIELYPTTEVVELAKVCQVSGTTIRRWAKKLGLQKTLIRLNN
jgi:hypothetical protein